MLMPPLKTRYTNIYRLFSDRVITFKGKRRINLELMSATNVFNECRRRMALLKVREGKKGEERGRLITKFKQPFA
jgi:hypothetical protein